MKARTALFFATTLWLGCTAIAISQQTEPNVPAQIVVTINTQERAAPISKYLYGGFIEEGGTLISRSLWAEMLDDRKFYFPINSEVTPAPTSQQRRPSFLTPLRKWRPVGPDADIMMDRSHPFVGDQSPRIALDSSTPHGIRQSGIALLKGKKYAGRIYMRGTPGTKVKVSVIWGQSAHSLQTISITSLTEAYKKYLLRESLIKSGRCVSSV